jgi:hypothetical protein
VDVLNAILPPREYLDEHQRRLQQAVSSAPSSRDQVITLQMKLDERLQERQARENGICPVREELYSQGFGEEMMHMWLANVISSRSLLTGFHGLFFFQMN